MLDNAETNKSPRPDVPRYFRVACHFWSDEKVVTWPDSQKLLALYLLTTKHRTLEGYFVLPPQYIAADIGWPLRRVKDMLVKLEGEGFVRFDERTNLLLIRNALRYQQPDSKNVQKAVIARVRNLPESQELLNEFLALARAHCLRSGLSQFAQGFPALLEREFRPVSNERQEVARMVV
ncbi:MAG: hypothetical protein HZC50_09600 [Nitrospirae bacterium]|nr:hypothetical protein [Nitrospirota bacterium]